jgi:alpha-galactosidase
VSTESAQQWLEIDVGGLRHDLLPGASLTCPRIFLCVASGDRDDATNAAHAYLKAQVFPKPLPSSPWIVYDIWGTETSGVEQALLEEIDVAASLGVELFYVDAAWYEGSSKRGKGDWGCGLGNYAEDREKFPSGLARMSDRVHARGMKFGLWVGPNIVDSRLLGGAIPHRWIAQAGGKDRVLNIKEWESTCHQVCLGCREYLEHLKANLERIVREYKLDWLKWDNSGIPGMPGQCDRPDHGHQSGDGSHAALLGQYEIFDFLHRRFPDLVLEQCGYGSRLDYGLARTIRANWLSDASFPSSHVRGNALLAGYVYPSYYNGAWVIKEPELEKTTDPLLLDTIFRSRMLGLFGFGTLHGMLSERVSLFPAHVLDAARRNISVYKKYRHLLQERVYRHSPISGAGGQWQAAVFGKPDGSEAVALCFRNGSTQSSQRIPLRNLDAGGTYTIISANGAPERKTSGRELISDGLIVSLPKPEMSDVLFLQLSP